MNKAPTELDRKQGLDLVNHELNVCYIMFYKDSINLADKCKFIENVIYNQSKDCKTYKKYLLNVCKLMSKQSYLNKIIKKEMNDLRILISKSNVETDDYFMVRANTILTNALRTSYESFDIKLNEDQIEELVDKLVDKIYDYSEELCENSDNLETTLEDMFAIIIARISINIQTKIGFTKLMEMKKKIGKYIRMDADKLDPDLYKNIKEGYELRTKQTVTFRSSTLYNCPKCKVNNCTLRDHMSSRADEGINKEAKCLACGNSWYIKG